MLKRIALSVLASCMALLTACGDCAGVGRPAFEINVVDARDGRALTDSLVIYVFQHPELALVDTVSAVSLPGKYWTLDRTGTFDVIVERPGYFPWSANNQVVKGECSTETRYLTARLIPRSA